MVPHKQKIHATETLQNRNENQQKLWINKNQLFRLTIHIRLGSEGTVRQFGYVYFTIMNFISVILFQTAFQVLTTKSRWWARAAASRRRWQQAASLDGHHCPNTSAVTISQQPKNTQKNLLPQNSAHFYSLNDSICFYAIFLYRERNAFDFSKQFRNFAAWRAWIPVGGRSRRGLTLTWAHPAARAPPNDFRAILAKILAD